MAKKVMELKGEEKLSDSLLASSFGDCMRRALELFGMFGLSGAPQFIGVYKAYTSMILEMCKQVKLHLVNANHYDTLYKLVALFCQVHEDTHISTFGDILTALLDSILVSNATRTGFFPALNDLMNPLDNGALWFQENEVDFNRVAVSLLLFGFKHATVGHLFAPHAEEWISLFFKLLAVTWPTLQAKFSYRTLLEACAQNTFRFSVTSTGTNRDCIQQLARFCQAHLFNTHPLIHNIALDLWCIIIDNTSQALTSDIPHQLASVVLHIFNRFFSPTSNPTPISLTALQALNPIRLKLRSILYRVLTCIAPRYRSNIDTNLADHIPLFQVLKCDDAEIGDGDLFLLDVLPLAFMAVNQRYEELVRLIFGMLPRGILEKDTQPSARTLLCLRALHNIFSQMGVTWSGPTKASLSVYVNAVLSSLKSASQRESIDGEALSIFLDIQSLPTLKDTVPWKRHIFAVTDSLHFLPTVAKIAFVQFIAKYIATASSEEVYDLNNHLSQIFNIFLADQEWIVAAEALVAYFAIFKKCSFSVEHEKGAKKIFEYYNSPTEVPVAMKAQSHLVSFSKDPNTAHILDSVELLRSHLLRYAEERVDNSTEGQHLIQEFLKTTERLKELEASLAIANGTVL